MSAHSADEQHLQHALELARQGIGLASPGPYVGAVIVDAHGQVASTGTYTYAGVTHAEILALEAAGSRARGGTLYINLEPHGHQGRTPPCTDALIAAGIHRVVASMPDPNPKVSGRGFEQLRAAGVHVEVGRLEEQARRLNEAFARYIRHRVPLVMLKAAMTLDGKIAPPPSEALTSASGTPAGGWVTSEVARAHVQSQRHQHDALLVGAGTILSDNPLLTDRSGRPRRRPLLRVILDSRLRLPLTSRLVQNVAAERKNDVLVFCSSSDEQKREELERVGIRVENVPAIEPDGRPDLHGILRRLGELEITSVMIEGGATVNWTALASNVVDKVFLYYAPKILAGTGSIPFAAGAGFRHMSQAAQVKHVHLHHFGEDFAVEGYLRDPYGE
ncbi:MAG TPA: bifunctional diaminohydroxyphosphoribosylaminopyrimidine deaminase/5-amino-6-(5-phosphoribosylamino)uracil reductase RibD [Candidatus Dormibacteraeota bacterium]|nr:bifunctional diaminohydroxyphosphoribosylaminopyrimidine deaminase/5-amino-6-(5-phosphoribosylamino)uracil reductase RibD [Candidatus Dormibacteraeota bacterium]